MNLIRSRSRHHANPVESDTRPAKEGKWVTWTGPANPVSGSAIPASSTTPPPTISNRLTRSLTKRRNTAQQNTVTRSRSTGRMGSLRSKGTLGSTSTPGRLTRLKSLRSLFNRHVSAPASTPGSKQNSRVGSAATLVQPHRHINDGNRQFQTAKPEHSRPFPLGPPAFRNLFTTSSHSDRSTGSNQQYQNHHHQQPPKTSPAPSSGPTVDCSNPQLFRSVTGSADQLPRLPSRKGISTSAVKPHDSYTNSQTRQFQIPADIPDGGLDRYSVMFQSVLAKGLQRRPEKEPASSSLARGRRTHSVSMLKPVVIKSTKSDNDTEPDTDTDKDRPNRPHETALPHSISSTPQRMVHQKSTADGVLGDAPALARPSVNRLVLTRDSLERIGVSPRTQTASIPPPPLPCENVFMLSRSLTTSCTASPPSRVLPNKQVTRAGSVSKRVLPDLPPLPPKSANRRVVTAPTVLSELPVPTVPSTTTPAVATPLKISLPPRKDSLNHFASPIDSGYSENGTPVTYIQTRQQHSQPVYLGAAAAGGLKSGTSSGSNTPRTRRSRGRTSPLNQAGSGSGSGSENGSTNTTVTVMNSTRRHSKPASPSTPINIVRLVDVKPPSDLARKRHSMQVSPRLLDLNMLRSGQSPVSTAYSPTDRSSVFGPGPVGRMSGLREDDGAGDRSTLMGIYTAKPMLLSRATTVTATVSSGPAVSEVQVGTSRGATVVSSSKAAANAARDRYFKRLAAAGAVEPGCAAGPVSAADSSAGADPVNAAGTPVLSHSSTGHPARPKVMMAQRVQIVNL